MARKTKAPAASRTRKKKATKKGAKTWPVSPVAILYLKTFRDELDRQWNVALKIVAKESGVPDGTNASIGKDNLWHEEKKV